MHARKTNTHHHPALMGSIYTHNAGWPWGPKRARAHSAYSYATGLMTPWRTLRRVFRHGAIDSNTYKSLTRQEAQCTEAPFTSFRVHSTHKGEEIGVNPVSREETVLLLIRAPYPRPLMALSRRFRSGTGTSVLSVCPCQALL